MTVELITNQNDMYHAWSKTKRPHGFKPMVVNGLRQFVPVNVLGNVIPTDEQLINNAYLAREEWETLDSTVYEMARIATGAWSDVMGAGLTRPSSLAVMSSKWSVKSEMAGPANIHMKLGTRRNRERTDRKFYGVPIPFISEEFSIDTRDLMAARMAGQALDVTETQEATSLVLETAEGILINGVTDPTVLSNTIPGYRSLTSRLTGTAASFGGGDFGTISNIYPTFLGVLSALDQIRYGGPFRVYVAKPQYWEMQQRYTDGTDRSALSVVLDIPEIQAVEKNDLVPDGQMVLVQMTRNVQDIEMALTLEVRQWEAVDGSELGFLVVMAAAPRLKTDYDGNAGIAHVTAI